MILPLKLMVVRFSHSWHWQITQSEPVCHFSEEFQIQCIVHSFTLFELTLAVNKLVYFPSDDVGKQSVVSQSHN